MKYLFITFDILFFLVLIVLCFFIYKQTIVTRQEYKKIEQRLDQLDKKMGPSPMPLLPSPTSVPIPLPTLLPEMTDTGMYRYQDAGYMFVFSPDYAYDDSKMGEGKVMFSNTTNEVFSILRISDEKLIQEGIEKAMKANIPQKTQEINSEEKKFNSVSVIKKTLAICETNECTGLTSEHQYLYGVKIKGAFILFHCFGMSEHDFETTILNTVTVY